MVMASSNGGGSPEQDEALKRSIVSTPDTHGSASPPSLSPADYVIWVGSVGDAIMPWGKLPKTRDAQLRAFFPTENYLLSAIGTIAGRNAAFSWKLEGPEKLVKMAQDMLLNANRGLGWENWVTKISIDLATQDSGAFVEIIRATDNPTAPVVNFAHLDAGRCYPTGDPNTPVIYKDRLDRFHALKWYQVWPLLETPSPVESYQGPLYGLQFSATSKVLKAAQILKSISTYQDEKLSGRNESAIHLIRGIDVKKIEDALRQTRAIADSQGLTRYIRPAMVGSHNPDAEVGHDTIELASLPPNFDLEVTMKWYISAMALALNIDYQDLAPLPNGNLGSGKQSEILHMKSRGKGPALWQKLIEHFINNSGVLPDGVTFRFDEQDMQAEQEMANMQLIRAQARAARVVSTEIDGEAARQIALDVGDLTQEQYDALEKRAQESKAKAEAMAAQQPPPGANAAAAVDRAAGAAPVANKRPPDGGNLGKPGDGGGGSDASVENTQPVKTAKEFDESQHPRDTAGRFAAGDTVLPWPETIYQGMGTEEAIHLTGRHLREMARNSGGRLRISEATHNIDRGQIMLRGTDYAGRRTDVQGTPEFIARELYAMAHREGQMPIEKMFGINGPRPREEPLYSHGKERVPPGRRELEAEVLDPIEGILSDVARTVRGRLRALAAPGPDEEQKDYRPRQKPRRVLKTVTAQDYKGHAMQVLEEELSA